MLSLNPPWSVFFQFLLFFVVFFSVCVENCPVSFPPDLNMAEMTHVCAQNKMVMVSGLALILNQAFYLGTFEAAII